MSTGGDSSSVLKAAAGVAFVAGVVLFLDSWDWLYENALNLPRATPALIPQLGALAVIALGYVLWAASSRPELAAVAARAGVIAFGGGAALIAAWLIVRGKDDLYIGDRGTAVLIGGAVVLAVTAGALARVARSE